MCDIALLTMEVKAYTKNSTSVSFPLQISYELYLILTTPTQGIDYKHFYKTALIIYVYGFQVFRHPVFHTKQQIYNRNNSLEEGITDPGEMRQLIQGPRIP